MITSIKKLEALRDDLAAPEAHAFDFKLPIIAEWLTAIIKELKSQARVQRAMGTYHRQIEKNIRAKSIPLDELKELQTYVDERGVNSTGEARALWEDICNAIEEKLIAFRK